MKKYLLFESSEDALKYVGEEEKRLVKAGGTSICLTRRGSQLIAFDNSCPHRGHPLVEGNINHLGEMVCASHAYRFDLKNGHETENRCDGLKFYSVIIEDGKIFLEI